MDEMLPPAGVTLRSLDRPEAVDVVPEFLEWDHASGELHLSEPSADVEQFLRDHSQGNLVIEAPGVDEVQVLGTATLVNEDHQGRNLRFVFDVVSTSTPL